MLVNFVALTVWGLSLLLICVYMPGDGSVSSFNQYLNTLGELEGFIDSHPCSVYINCWRF